MPARLRAVLGESASIRVVIVQRGDAIAPDMGADARPVIQSALRDLGVETRRCRASTRGGSALSAATTRRPICSACRRRRITRKRT
jgi:hypothetical protein